MQSHLMALLARKGTVSSQVTGLTLIGLVVFFLALVVP